MIGSFSASGPSTDEARKDGNIFGLVCRFSKRHLAAHQVGHQARLTGVYADTVEINGGSMTAAGGYTTTFGLVSALICFYLFRNIIFEAFKEGSGGYAFLIFCTPTFFSIFLVGIYFEMFSPSEQPIYFDRLRRKVYYVHRGSRRRFWLFGPSTVEARVIDWDLVDAEHHAKVRASTASVGRDHYLLFLMRTNADDPTIADHYVLGPVDFPGALWEYIRRYMEKGAAPLAADETPPDKSAYFDMVEALKLRVKHYRQDWNEFFWTQLWQHLVLPLFAVFFLVNRCVVWSAQKVHWPQEVKDALGPAVTADDVKEGGPHAALRSDVTIAWQAEQPRRNTKPIGGTSERKPRKPRRKRTKPAADDAPAPKDDGEDRPA